MKTNKFKKAVQILNKMRTNKRETIAENHVYNCDVNHMNRVLTLKIKKS